MKIGQERYRAPEILFDPELIGLEYPGVHQIVQDAITRTDLDLRKSLYLNIVLSGGSTLCKNFPDRLMREIKRLAVEDMKIRISAPAERKYTTWIGGSILAGLSTFRKVCTSPLPQWTMTNGLSLDVGERRRVARRPRGYPQAVRLIKRPLTGASHSPVASTCPPVLSSTPPAHAHCPHAAPKTPQIQEQYLVNTNRSLCNCSASETRSTNTTNPSCVATLDTPVSIFLSSLCLGIASDSLCKYILFCVLETGLLGQDLNVDIAGYI